VLEKRLAETVAFPGQLTEPSMRQILLFVFLVLAVPVLAQQQVNIIELRHRTVEDVLPVLQPLVEPGGAISGMSGQLIIRTSPGNLDDLKKVLAAIDRPPRQLLIRVSQSREMDSRQGNFGVTGSAELGGNVRIVSPGGRAPGGAGVEIQSGGSAVKVQGGSVRRSSESRADQFVKVMDGGQAFIQVGRSLAVPFRRVTLRPDGVTVTDSVVYRDIGQGFSAVPRLVGDQVTVEISPQFDSPGSGGRGSVDTQNLTTTISGRLGDWIELGGSAQQMQGDESRMTGKASTEMRDTRSVWLLIEELP
jgi:hypothetical protein